MKKIEVVYEYIICKFSHTVLSSSSSWPTVSSGDTVKEEEQAWSLGLGPQGSTTQYVVVANTDSILLWFFFPQLVSQNKYFFITLYSSSSMFHTSVCQDPVALITAPSVVL